VVCIQLLPPLLSHSRSNRRDDVLELTFPQRIGRLTLQGRITYPLPGAGYSVRYQDDLLFKVDVYIYETRTAGVPDGIASEAVKQELVQVARSISMMENRGSYADVQKLDEGEASFGRAKLPFLRCRWQYRQTPGSGIAYSGLRVSEVYLCARRGEFVKVRATMKAEQFAARQDEIHQFMDQFADLLAAMPTTSSSESNPGDQP